jgi:hypothetical protein
VKSGRKTYAGEEAVNAALLLESRAVTVASGNVADVNKTSTVVMPPWKARLLARKQKNG